MKIVESAIACEICGTATPDDKNRLDSILFPNKGRQAMVHGACVRAEVASGNLKIIDGKVIESLELYCDHFGNETMPNKVGDDEDA